MNRRNFLKKVGAACAGIIVAPIALLKKKKSVPFVDVDAPVTWKHFYAEFKFEPSERQELLKKFRKAFQNTKFQPPLSPKYPYGLPPWMEIT